MGKKNKILLVSSAFYPEISPRSFRATELAKEISRQGNEVYVLSKFRDYDYNDFLREFKITLKMWKKPILPKIPDSNNKFLSRICNIVARLLLLLFEYPKIEEMFRVREMLSHESGFDIMISFAVPYPVHWGVAWSRSSDHPIATVWVADCGDPYMGDVLDSFRKVFYFKYFEKWFCRKCNFITIPIESAKPGYYPEFHYKIRIIPQGFDFEIEDKNDEYFENKIPTFAYAGGFLPGSRDPRPLIETLISLSVPFRFWIFTNTPDLVNPYKEKLKESLIISDYIPRPELLKVLKKMDFLINFDNNTTLNSPSKLIDYAITNRPILNIKRDLCREDLISFLNRDYRNALVVGDIKIYHIRNVSRLFLNLLTDCVGNAQQ